MLLGVVVLCCNFAAEGQGWDVIKHTIARKKNVQKMEKILILGNLLFNLIELVLKMEL